MVNLNVTLEEGPQRNYAYYAGHELKGKVELSSSKKHTARGLYVEVVGKAKANWSTRSGNTSTYYSGDELYIKSRTYLFGEHSGATLEIPAGVHRYNYSFKLPAQLPDSLDIPKGEIKYYIKVVLDIPWAIDEEVKIPITIISLSDLNLIEHVKAPKNVEYSESFLSFSGNFEPFRMIVSLPYTGFVAGQEVQFTINYTNGSSVEVKKTKIKMKREIMYITTDKKHSRIEINDYELPVQKGVKPHSNENITARFRVPQVSPTFDGLCKVITIKYRLNIKAEVNGFYTAPKISIPIIIGTIPIRANYRSSAEVHAPTAPSISRPAVEVHAPTAPMDPLGPIEPSAPPNYEEDLPPPFEVAINMPKFKNPEELNNSDKS